MRITLMAALIGSAICANFAYADTCPKVESINKTGQGFTATDPRGRIWRGENPTLVNVDQKNTQFESVTHITEDEDETGPIKVNQISCRYGNLALVMDVDDFKSTSADWNKTDHCTASLTKCSFSINE